jgi:oligopeptide/dipeptide ABC transporter ATP-binding protein
MREGSLLSIRDLSVRFETDSGDVRAVNHVSLDLARGEIAALVGESGSGKTVTALAIMRLLPRSSARITAGHIWLEGTDLLSLDETQMRAVRGRDISMVFQEPMTSLNPVMTIGTQITESLKRHLGLSAKAAADRAAELLNMVGVPDARRRLADYPHRLSGGMRQRVMVAIALGCEPKLVLADEPTTALDVTIQAQVLELLTSLARRLGASVILITHNLGVVARYADRVHVMYAGRLVESASARTLYAEPRHPYTLGLLRSVPRLDRVRRDVLVGIDGNPPDMLSLPPGCAFSPRCPYAVDRCRYEDPPPFVVGDAHTAACWEWERVARATSQSDKDSDGRIRPTIAANN